MSPGWICLLVSVGLTLLYQAVNLCGWRDKQRQGRDLWDSKAERAARAEGWFWLLLLLGAVVLAHFVAKSFNPMIGDK
jgi:hypothetical protein